MNNKALVVIDLQNDITKNYKEIIGAVNRAVDWATGNGMQVIYIKHNNLSAGTRTFKPDTHGAELVPEMKIMTGNIFTKTKGNALTSEAFDAFVRERGIKEFYLAGADAGKDVDVVLTTREVVRMIRAENIIPSALKEEEFDVPLGVGSGAGEIFGATGGVMEAALRSAYFLVTGTNPDPDAFKDVRGIKGWKEATFEIAGVPLHVAVANGLSNARDLLEALKKGEVKYDFVEVMACPGGCVGGGGQPIHDRTEMAKERGQILYDLDRNNPIRFSHKNPSIIKCYENYLQRPLSHRAHQLLHTDHNGWSLQDLKYGAELRTDEKSSLTDKH